MDWQCLAQTLPSAVTNTGMSGTVVFMPDVSHPDASKNATKATDKFFTRAALRVLGR
jgi:hypothetical protein